MNPTPRSAPDDPARERHPVADIDDYITGQLDPDDHRRIEEHLEDCIDCARYSRQLATTVQLLGARQPLQQPQVVDESEPSMGPARAFRDHGPRLLTLARAIDPPHAEDVVQDAWLDVLEAPARTGLTMAELAGKVAALAADHLERDSRDIAASAVEAEWQQHQEEALPPDRDADYAEVFLPDLYQQDQDGLGRWLTGPNEWPAPGPDTEPASHHDTVQLIGVVDTALAQLPARSRDLLSSVDLDGVDVGLLARATRRSPASIKAELAAARDHVRSVLDDYLAEDFGSESVPHARSSTGRTAP